MLVFFCSFEWHPTNAKQGALLRDIAAIDIIDVNVDMNKVLLV
jgi:hypothetical protein